MSKKPDILLISPYDLGRQPFALAHNHRWLSDHGFNVKCLDLSIQKLDLDELQQADLIGLYLGMHTATRIALKALPKINQFAPKATLFAFGLYAPLNQDVLSQHQVQYCFGGESEPDILTLAQRLTDPIDSSPQSNAISHKKIAFKVPYRDDLPPLSRYAKLILADATQKTVGFIEASRGCKYLCRHCPVTPIYEGKFRIVAVDIVIQDIAQQVAMGAQHISFGDPDFFNGPTHAKKVLQAMHTAFPQLSFDCTIKIEHVLKHADLLPILKSTGCLFITCAVESFNDDILLKLDKGHSRADTFQAVALLKQQGLTISPTFVPFSPWTSLDDYRELLQDVVSLELINEVAPIQLAIRLLIPNGSYLLKLPDFSSLIDDFDPITLGYPWRHQQAGVDELQLTVMSIVEAADQNQQDRFDTFKAIWHATHQALNMSSPTLAAHEIKQVPHLSEAWYCCAEPTNEQINSF
ncbi:MAG: radical SAM protein [Cycloclasticus sp.]|nr:radical SAM protein [Cycloclasticus sp.]MBQ0790354.1 radical SAM protein [Cycloclasticus sp.]